MARQLFRTCPPLQGRGIHSGQQSRLLIGPLLPGSGLCFVRLDLNPAVRIPALLAHAVPSARKTLLQLCGSKICTPEHVLAALAGLGIQDAELGLQGEEVRHKVLDTMGELGLLGPEPLMARASMERGSHRLLITALQQGVAAGALSRISLNI